MPQMTDNAVLVVAHPDDEVLWFSAVLRKVDQVLICFLDYKPIPSIGPARRQIIAEYPIENVIGLELVEAGTFNSVDWDNPKETTYGLEILHDNPTLSRYQQNFRILCEQLRPILAGFDNVITHNPWGEYGHPDHVQVYRAIKNLQTESDFKLWYSNYCGDRSAKLALKNISKIECEGISLPTDIEIAAELKTIYQRHGCWSWFDDYEWFRNENYILDQSPGNPDKAYGKLPLNMIYSDFPHAPESNLKHRVRNKLLSVGRRLIRLLKSGNTST